MLLIVFVLILIAGFIMERLNHKGSYDLDNAAFGVRFLGVMAIIISIVLMSVFYIGADSLIRANEVHYETLIYKYEHIDDLYKYDAYKQDIVNEIREWNEYLAMRQSLQDNFWVGIYIPDIYDQFEFIKLE